MPLKLVLPYDQVFSGPFPRQFHSIPADDTHTRPAKSIFKLVEQQRSHTGEYETMR